MTRQVRRAGLDEVAALRRQVLRPGQALESTLYPQDAHALHVAAFEDGRVIGTATFFPMPFPGPGEADGPEDAEVPPGADGLVAWRLRGMATDPAQRSCGIGSSVLVTGLAEVVASGGELVWCNARTAALGFYTRHGFVTVGSEFLSGGAVLVPHYRAWLRLVP